jgi:hypothetical protein
MLMIKERWTSYGLRSPREQKRNMVHVTKGLRRTSRELVGSCLSLIQLYRTSASETVKGWGSSRMDVRVHLHRSIDFSTILSGRKLLNSRPDIIIKPNLSPLERKVEQLLLKEHRCLINSGTQRRDIMYVSNGSVTVVYSWRSIIDIPSGRDSPLNQSPQTNTLNPQNPHRLYTRVLQPPRLVAADPRQND